MGFKQSLLNVYNWAAQPKHKIDARQKRIRDTEWAPLEKYIPSNSTFLDVGCGAGNNMIKALEKGCQVSGIDPEPGAHGVGRYNTSSTEGLAISQGFAEQLPYSDQEFDVVFSSHVLEHVQSVSKSLGEMNRVLNNEGTAIIGMPTAEMARLNMISQWLFQTHIRLVNYFMKPFITTGKVNFKQVLFGYSHSWPDKTCLADIKHYKVSNWKQMIEQVFEIEAILLPAWYPYPDYPQLFSMKQKRHKASSVFFVCKKTNKS